MERAIIEVKKEGSACGFHICNVLRRYSLRIHNIHYSSLSLVSDDILPDRHEIEDIRHSRAVTKQIIQTELEDYGSNQNTVPAQINTLIIEQAEADSCFHMKLIDKNIKRSNVSLFFMYK